jgi:hypothetical protein
MGVDEVAVVRHGERSVARLAQNRLGIAGFGTSGSGIAVVADGDIAGESA